MPHTPVNSGRQTQPFVREEVTRPYNMKGPPDPPVY